MKKWFLILSLLVPLMGIVTNVQGESEEIDFQLEINGRNITNPTAFPTRNTQINIFEGDLIQFTVLKRQYPTTTTKFEYRWQVLSSKRSTYFGKTKFLAQTSTEILFDHVGEFLIIVEGQNEEGISATVSRKIKVFPRPAIKIGMITNPRNIFVGEWTTFLPQIKIQALGRPKIYASSFQFRFDIDDDDIWDSHFRSGGNHRWRLDAPGKYRVKMQVQDPWGEIQTIYKTIVVRPIPKPIAHVEVSNKYGTPDTLFRFDAQKSKGHNISFFWKIGNGKFKKRGPQFFQKFSAPGKKWITLRVMDRNLLFNEIQFSVIVKKAPEKLKIISPKTTNKRPKRSLMAFASPFVEKKTRTYSENNVWILPPRMH